MRRDTSNGTFLKPNSRQWPPCPCWKGPNPPPCKHYIFFSFRRGGGQLVVCEHGVERVDLPGDPLPEGPHLLLVTLLRLLALPSPVTTSSDVFEISGKVMTVVGTQKNWATTLSVSSLVCLLTSWILGLAHLLHPFAGLSKWKKPSPSEQNGTTLIQTFLSHLESRSS